MIRKQTGLGEIVQSIAIAKMSGGLATPAKVAAARGWAQATAEFKSAVGDIGAPSGFVIGEPRATAIIGSIPRNSLSGEIAFAARPLPAWHTRYLVTQSEDLIAAEVAEGMPVPCAGTAATSILISPNKCALMFVVSEEVMRDSDAGPVLESDFSIALRRGLDAVILSRLAPDSTSALSATSDPMLDLRALLAQLNTTGILNPILIPAVDVALRMATLRDQGGYVFAEMSAAGGNALGCPAFTNDQLAPGTMRAINGESVGFKVSGIEVAASRNASIQMNNNPTMDATQGTGTTLVDMFTSNTLAIMFRVNFALAVLRDGLASSELDGINW